MPNTENPLTGQPLALRWPAYVQCASCIYWVPVTDCADNGECSDCFLGPNADEFPF